MKKLIQTCILIVLFMFGMNVYAETNNSKACNRIAENYASKSMLFNSKMIDIGYKISNGGGSYLSDAISLNVKDLVADLKLHQKHNCSDVNLVNKVAEIAYKNQQNGYKQRYIFNAKLTHQYCADINSNITMLLKYNLVMSLVAGNEVDYLAKILPFILQKGNEIYFDYISFYTGTTIFNADDIKKLTVKQIEIGNKKAKELSDIYAMALYLQHMRTETFCSK